MSERLQQDALADKGHATGDAKLSDSIVEYGDYGCSDCRRLHDVLCAVRSESGRPLQYVFRHLPLVSSGPNPMAKAIAAEAAARQGLFWEMHAALFRHASAGDENILLAAREAGLDLERFEADRADPAIAEEVQQDIDQALAHGIAQVPTLFIRGRKYTGTWDVESIREAAQPPLAGRVHTLALDFARWAAGSSALLIVATVLALLWRNGPFGHGYETLWHLEAGLMAAGRSLVMSLHHWVNDLLMAVFFLVVGLELKREIRAGELADPKRAVLPIAAALGGMVVPAGIYLAFNAGTDRVAGWGVPMATDIAFTLGVLALLGTRVPASMKVFATALAIVDDLGAILVLAIFYNHGLSWEAIGAALLLMLLLLGFNRARVYALWPYLTVGTLLWLAVYLSGLHATLAGVMLAVTIPTRRQAPLLPLLAQGSAGIQQAIKRLENDTDREEEERQRMAQRVRSIEERLVPSAERLEHALQPWSAYLILPIFALSNAGILISFEHVSVTDPVMLGVVLALVIGKPLGIFAGTFLVDRLGLGRKPDDARWSHIFGVGCLCGIGFTMSIFIANEAFAAGTPVESAKLAVIAASVMAAIIGFVHLRFLTPSARGVPA